MLLRLLGLLTEISLERDSGLLLMSLMMAGPGRRPGLLLVPALLTDVGCCLGL